MSLHKVKECEGEDGSLTGKPLSLSSDGEVLAWKPARPQGCFGHVYHARDVAEVRNVGPAFRKDRAWVRLDLREADRLPARPLQPDVHPAHAAEERGVRQTTHASLTGIGHLRNEGGATKREERSLMRRGSRFGSPFQSRTFVCGSRSSAARWRGE